jgi:hypothetical protein
MELSELKRDQVRWVSGIRIGHCCLKRRLFRLGLTQNPTCKRCHNRLICYVIVRPWLTFHRLGHYFMKPYNFLKVSTLHSKCRIVRTLSRRGHTTDQRWSQCKGPFGLSFIHSFKCNVCALILLDVVK